MVRRITEATQIIGLLEGGQLASDLSDEIRKTIQDLQEHAGATGTAKGKVALTLSFEQSGEKTEVVADIATKLPKRQRRTSFFFTTDDGALSIEHPRQHDMFKPREAAPSRETQAAGG